MNSFSDRLTKQYGRPNSSKISGGSDVFEPSAIRHNDIEANQRAVLVDWINSILPNLNLPVKASSEELRACLIDGTVLLQILNRIRPRFSYEASGDNSENVKKFLACMDELGIFKFKLSDLEKGSMKSVLDCLSTLRAQFIYMGGNLSPTSGISKYDSPRGGASSNGLVSSAFGEEKRKFSPDSKLQQALRSPVMPEPPAALMHHVGHKFHEVFQLKQGRYSDLSAAKISEMIKSNSLDNAPTQSLLSVVNGILDESIERKSDEIPHIEKSKVEGKKKLEEQHVAKLTKEREQRDTELSALKQELEIARQKHELRGLQMEAEAQVAKEGLEERLRELELHLEDARKNVKMLEAYSKSKSQRFNKKEHIFKSSAEFQFGALQELRLSSKSIKFEILEVQKSYAEEFNGLGVKLKALLDSTSDYQIVLAENKRMYNELQELKGNIRVYCRIRPFLPGQVGKQTTIEYIGENGELVVVNPSKQGKERHRNFRFNKVFGPESTQAEVFSDTQPLIRSVLDGYNVCIFAYGQTGSGKTYTMVGPDGASEEDWGVNYRALNDLFLISKNRRGSFTYGIEVQMVEIYNEQVRDLLMGDSSQKKLGIMSTVQSNGLAVPDASMHPVTSTSDVLQLMDIGFKNRAVGATAMNERSSRSHSVVSIHVHGKDLHSGAALHGNLHLVDLAGSERVDRSEATGDRLREAQHINKSLSALGDVIFALAQKNSHVPYRNSKLTQLLQSSLGGHAKTLMFLQLNPDVNSYSETLSTLKFAERVSGVELGAARTSKEGRDVRELMDQVASLKDTIAKKDDEIEQLQLVKHLKNIHPSTTMSGSSSLGNDSSGGILQGTQKPSDTKSLGNETTSTHESNSEYSDRHSEADSQQSKLSEGDIVPDMQFGDAELSRFGDGEYDDIHDGDLPVAEEPDGGSKLSNKLQKSKVASTIRLLQNQAPTTSKTVIVSRDASKGSMSVKKTGTSTLVKPSTSKRWQ